MEIGLADALNYYPLQDMLYRTSALTNSSGTIIETYDTDAYGRTIIFSGYGVNYTWFTDDDDTTENPTCEFIFTGRRYDPESEIYFYRARYYNPELGRFISKDPEGYEAGMSLYEYVASKPGKHLDAYGQKISLDCCKSMLNIALGNPRVKKLYNKAKAKSRLGMPCLSWVHCIPHWIGAGGAYNPLTRDVFMAAWSLSSSQASFTRILYHELTHALSVCGLWRLGCKNCMIEEKRAYFYAGQCINDVDCTRRTFGSCKMSLSCSSVFNKRSDYYGVGWPPLPAR